MAVLRSELWHHERSTTCGTRKDHMVAVIVIERHLIVLIVGEARTPLGTVSPAGRCAVAVAKQLRKVNHLQDTVHSRVLIIGRSWSGGFLVFGCLGILKGTDYCSDLQSAACA